MQHDEMNEHHLRIGTVAIGFFVFFIVVILYLFIQSAKPHFGLSSTILRNTQRSVGPATHVNTPALQTPVSLQDLQKELLTATLPGPLLIDMRKGKLIVEIQSDTSAGAIALRRVALASGKAITFYKKNILGTGTLQAQKNDDHLELLQTDRSGAVVAKATTNLPLVVDPTSNTLSAQTFKGKAMVKLLPQDVIDFVTEAGVVDLVTSVELTDQSFTSSSDQLQYKVTGSKQVKLLNLIPMHVELSQSMNASTGMYVEAETPWFFDVFGFLFAVN